MAMTARSSFAPTSPNTTSSWASNSRMLEISITAKAPRTDLRTPVSRERLRAGLCTIFRKGCFFRTIGEIYLAHLASIKRRTLHPDLDRVDLRMRALIQEHGSLSAAEVAERLSMTASTCRRGVSRRAQLGLVRRRVALRDRAKLGRSALVFPDVKLAG